MAPRHGAAARAEAEHAARRAARTVHEPADILPPKPRLAAAPPAKAEPGVRCRKCGAVSPLKAVVCVQCDAWL